MSEIPKWQASIQYLYPGEATSGRMAVYLADDVDAAIAAAEQRGRTIGYALGQADMRKYLLADDTHSYTYGHREGYADALREAREAVAALDPGPGLREDVGRALAAIDALKDTHVRRPDEVT